MRFTDNIIEYLEGIKWWNWPLEKILKNKLFISLNLNPDININQIKDIIVDL